MLFSGRNSAPTDFTSMLSTIDMKKKSAAKLKEKVDRYEEDLIDKKQKLTQMQINIDVFHEEMDSWTQQIQNDHTDPRREGWKSSRRSATLKWKSEKDDWLNMIQSVCTTHEHMSADSNELTVHLVEITDLQADVIIAMKKTAEQPCHPGIIVEKPGLQTRFKATNCFNDIFKCFPIVHAACHLVT
jgi:predicted RNase H-like nuclease (RuvC/YqgF family)